MAALFTAVLIREAAKEVFKPVALCNPPSKAAPYITHRDSAIFLHEKFIYLAFLDHHQKQPG